MLLGLTIIVWQCEVRKERESQQRQGQIKSSEKEKKEEDYGALN